MNDQRQGFGCILVALTIVLVYVTVHYWQNSRRAVREKPASAAKETLERQESERIEALASRFNAVTNWASAIPIRHSGPFTVDLSRALIRTNAAPVMFRAELNDVAESSGKLILTFSCEWQDLCKYGYEGDYCEIDLFLILSCSSDEGQTLLTLLSQSSGYSASFAVVAVIDSVSRPSFVSQDGKDIFLDLRERRFVCRGQLLSFVPISSQD